MRSAEVIEYLKKAPQTVAAWVCGVSSRTFRDRHEIPRNEDGSYDIKKVVAALLVDASGVIDGDDGGDSSEELRRLRLANAKLAELRYEREAGELISRDVVVEIWKLWSNFIRSAGEQISIECGEGAKKVLDDALDNCRRASDPILGGERVCDLRGEQQIIRETVAD